MKALTTILLASITLSFSAPSALVRADDRRGVAETPLGRVGISPRLGSTLPADLTFIGEAGPVTIDELADGRVVLLVPYYDGCPMLCELVLSGLARALELVDLSPGGDFVVVAVSFDPTETAVRAARARDTFVERSGLSNAEGVHFVRATEQTRNELLEALGYHLALDPATGEYAHPAAVVALTPSGTISRYLYGIDPAPRDIELGVVEASNGEVGDVGHALLLLCYAYDPATGRYSGAIVTGLRVGGAAAVVTLGWILFAAPRRRRRQP